MNRLLLPGLVLALALARAGASAAGDAADAGITDDAGTVEVEAAVEPGADPAPEPAPVPTPSTKANGLERFTLGAYAGLGMATAIADADRLKPRFAGGGGAYLDLYVLHHMAYEIGIGILGKGFRIEYEDSSVTDRFKLAYLDILLGLKWDIRDFRATIAVALDYGLAGRVVLGPPGATWERSYWEGVRRFNFGPVLGLGYAIPFGKSGRIVPGVSWSMHLLEDDIDGRASETWGELPGRYMNLMFRLDCEVGFDTRNAKAVFSPAPPPPRGFRPFALGAYASLGMSRNIGKYNGGEDFIWPEGADKGDAGPRFAGGGGAYLDWYLTQVFALDFGVGFVGKGYRLPSEAVEVRLRYLEIPLGAKLDLRGFRIGIALALEIALTGELQHPTNGDEADVHPWNDETWDAFRRVNFGPVLTLGYAIPIGRFAIVPGASWSMDILDYAKNDTHPADSELRLMNLMFHLGVEFGFGGGG